MSKKSNSTSPAEKPVIIMDNLQTTASINMAITKDDLVDLYIQEVVDQKQKYKDELNKEYNSIQNSESEKLKLAALKVLKASVKNILPLEDSHFNLDKLSVGYGRINIDISNDINLEVKLNKDEIYKTPKNVKDKISKLFLEIKNIENEISNIHKSGTRKLKAQLLKSLLNQTEEGAAILSNLSSFNSKNNLLNG